MMQKNKSLQFLQKNNRTSHTRCISAAYDPPDKNYKTTFSSGEVDTFALEFCKIIRSYLPNFKLPYSPEVLLSILEILPEALKAICNSQTTELTEQYLLKEQSYSKTSKNLVKYEELLKEKSAELEEEIKLWKLHKKNEVIIIESQKEDLRKAKIKLEQETNEVSSSLKEKESKLTSQLNEIEISRIETHNSKIRNQELEWKLLQTMKEIEEKEAILKMKEELIEKERREIITEKSILENEKMVNKVLNLELIRENNSRIQSRCASVSLFPDMGRSFSSESQFKPTSSSRLEIKQDETTFVITKQSFADILNIKKSLEVSAAELGDFQNNLMPELHEKAEQLFSGLFGELCKIKENAEVYLEETRGKYSEIAEKLRQLENLINENREKTENLEYKEKEIENLKRRLQEHISEVVLEKKKYEIEIEDFQKEKLEFYEDASRDRQRIQGYYNRIEEKVAVLDLRRTEIENTRQNLNDELDRKIIKKEHTRNKSAVV